MKLKSGVRLLGIKPELLIAIQVANDIWSKYGQELVITSGVEGAHKVGSKHYSGYGVDLRSRYFSENTKTKVVQELKDSLGSEFDVISHKTHIHIEYDP